LALEGDILEGSKIFSIEGYCVKTPVKESGLNKCLGKKLNFTRDWMIVGAQINGSQVIVSPNSMTWEG
jgi:hypothetical protein